METSVNAFHSGLFALLLESGSTNRCILNGVACHGLPDINSWGSTTALNVVPGRGAVRRPPAIIGFHSITV